MKDNNLNKMNTSLGLFIYREQEKEIAGLRDKICK